jgi:L-lactate dehydrogenase
MDTSTAAAVTPGPGATRLAIVGAGSVGATLAYQLSVQGLVPDIALIDTNREKAEAEALDIAQGTPLGRTVRIRAAGYEACRHAHIVVITAGAKQKPGETRLDLLERNAVLTRAITKSVVDTGFAGIFIVISNPVDVLTYLVWEQSGFPRERVIGSGTILDSARLREHISRHCRVSPQNIHAYVLGEHGDTSVPAWSLLTIAGVRLSEYCPACGHGCTLLAVKDEALRYVREAANTIIRAKGATFYAIAQAGSLLIRAILHDERRILPISTVHADYHGVVDTAFSLPTLVGHGGAEQVLAVSLSPAEEAELRASASFIAQAIASVRTPRRVSV